MEDAQETTIAVYELGRAYAACNPNMDEDTAVKDACKEQSLTPDEIVSFRRGFRSLD